MVKKFFDDLSQTDRESDSFRYPFHIVWELDEWEGKFVIKPIFNSINEIKAEMEAEYRAEMEAEYYAEMMAESDYN